MTSTKQLSVRLPDHLHKKLAHALVDSGLSFQTLAQRLIEQWLKEREQRIAETYEAIKQPTKDGK